MPDIFMTLNELGRNVETLRGQLKGLKALFGKDGPFPMMAVRARRPRRRRIAKTTARRQRVSAKVRNLRKLQGRYMGLVRNLTAAQKAQVKKVKELKGYGAAFKVAARLRK